MLSQYVILFKYYQEAIFTISFLNQVKYHNNFNIIKTSNHIFYTVYPEIMQEIIIYNNFSHYKQMSSNLKKYVLQK